MYFTTSEPESQKQITSSNTLTLRLWPVPCLQSYGEPHLPVRDLGTEQWTELGSGRVLVRLRQRQSGP
jgi:hypothetical protein